MKMESAGFAVTASLGALCAEGAQFMASYIFWPHPSTQKSCPFDSSSVKLGDFLALQWGDLMVIELAVLRKCGRRAEGW